jgi:hypothetical protein
MGLSTNRKLQPAHLPRHADQWGPGRYLVIPRWVVWGQPAGCGVAPVSLCGGRTATFDVAGVSIPSIFVTGVRAISVELTVDS